MVIFETLELTEVEALAILRLWNREYPERLKYTDLEEFYNYLSGLKPKKKKPVGWWIVAPEPASLIYKMNLVPAICRSV